MGLKQHIKDYIVRKYPEKVLGVELQRLAQEKYFGERYYSGETASRAARSLKEDKAIEVGKDGQLVYYKYIPQKLGVLNEDYSWRTKIKTEADGFKRSHQRQLV